MKKFFLATIVALSLLSCSGEQNVSAPKETEAVNPNVVARYSQQDFEVIYNRMVTSTEYLTYTSARSSFMAKMNYRGDGSIFESEAALLGWISSNLSSTTFSNYTAAQNEYSSLKILYTPVVNNHKDFFMATIDPENDDVFIDVLTPVDNIAEDSCGCKTSYYACCKGANKAYHGSVKRLTNMLVNFQISEDTYATNVFLANIRLNSDISTCKDALSLCQQGCE